mgnify:CR=1 FL=1
MARRFSRRVLAAAATIATLPILIILTAFVAAAFRGTPIPGPPAGTWFDRIGPLVAYAAPLGIIGLTFVAYALRDGSSQFALAGSLIVQLLIALVVAVPTWLAGDALHDVDVARYVVGNVEALGP